MITRILADNDEIRRVFIPSYHLDPKNNYHPILAKEWDNIYADIEALSKKSIASETVNNENYSIWRMESTRILPRATFVWLDELETVWYTAYSEKRMHIIDERPGDRKLNHSPLIPSNMASFIYEGFESLLINSKSSSSNNSQTVKICFEELHHYLNLDPFYGVESAATESIINDIYRGNAGNQLFQQFSHRFSLLPCKTDKQRHLIYLWCGLMGLPSYRGNQPLEWTRNDFLEHWRENFDLQLGEIKAFMRKHGWPLPTKLFPDEVDNTERKLALEEAEFDAASHDFTVALPKLQEDLEEVQNIQPASMAERKEKQTEIYRIEQEIETITKGSSAPIKADMPTETVSTVPLKTASDSSDTSALFDKDDSITANTAWSEAFDPIPLSGISQIFSLDKDVQQNQVIWKSLAEKASRNNLLEARISKGSGKAQSTFDPWLVAEWLINKGHISRDKALRKLANNLPPRSAHLKDLFLP